MCLGTLAWITLGRYFGALALGQVIEYSYLRIIRN